MSGGLCSITGNSCLVLDGSKDRKTIILPLHGALLKNEQDVQLFERLVFMSRNSR